MSNELKDWLLENERESMRDGSYCRFCGAPDLLERIATLQAENESLRDPNWVEYVVLTERWLEKYPPDIFTGVSGDSGPLFVVAIRNALKALKKEG